MIKNWLSRYHPRYPRSLVYMLQATEYNIGDYLRWHNRAEDFGNIEKRGRLKKTPKALALLVIAWLILAILYGIAFGFLWLGGAYRYLFFLLFLLLAPYFLAYGIIIPLSTAKIIQLPIEYLIVRQAARRLQKIKAVKIAIAGSFGKTSMREIIKTVLSEKKKTAAPPHSHNTPLGIAMFINSLKGDEEILIFELGEYYPGDVAKLCRLVNPDIGIITGVNEAHLQKFKNLERTAKTIFELADYLGNRPVYVNGENKIAGKNASSDHIIYSRESAGKWQIKEPRTDLNGTSFTLEKEGVKIETQSKLLGLHQVGPLAVAADIASYFGLTPEEIQKGIAKTSPFDHRLEPKTDTGGVITLDDSYNGNPDGVKAVIEFLAMLKNHRRFYVTPGLVEMGARAETVHEEIGRELVAANIEKVVLIRNSATPFIEKGLQENNYRGDILRFDNALSAFAALPHLTVKGDVILIQNDWPDQYQ